MQDKRKNNGGHKTNGGRHKIADEQKTNAIFISAIKQVKNVETDEEARIELAKDLLTFERGKIFISEHLFGKAKETIESNILLNDFSIKDLVNIK
jgi:hypothetical protein